MHDDKTYLVAGYKSWNREMFKKHLAFLPGNWTYADGPEELSPELVNKLKPRYIFFLHWSWKVLPEITDNFECVCFHPTPLPFGRGGTPIQHLIKKGWEETVITAFQMTSKMDAGPVYATIPMSLSGSADTIYRRFCRLSVGMVEEIAEKEPKPIPQQGEVVTFKRRTPDQSDMNGLTSLDEVHDHIRMLDAEGYPNAFLDFGPFRVMFRGSTLHDGAVSAEVTIQTIDKE